MRSDFANKNVPKNSDDAAQADQTTEAVTSTLKKAAKVYRAEKAIFGLIPGVDIGFAAADASNGDYGEAGTGLVLAALPMIRIGKFSVGRELFHRVIKTDILSDAKLVTNFEKIVGKNPNINVSKDGFVILEGTGSYKGQSITTELKAADYFN